MKMSAKQGRNDSCACGSGKKFKQCCMQTPLVSTIPSSSEMLRSAITNFENGNHQAAVSICQRILQIDANNFSAMTLLGILAFYAGNVELAIQLLEKSLAIQPKQADAHNNLGELFRATGKIQRALFHFQSALKINLHHLGALINCGNALQDIYKYTEAIKAYQAALKVMPNHPGALSNLANIYQQLYRHQDAVEVFSKLLQIAPDYDWAIGGRTYSQIHCCNWENYEKNILEIKEQVSLGKQAIKVFELRPISDDPVLELTCAKTFARTMYSFDETFNAKIAPIPQRIKIAYISADFREHPVSQLLVGVIEEHDRSIFEVIGISLGPDDGSIYRARIMNAFDEFIDMREQSDQQIIDFIRSMNVHIAIDLMGYTTHARPAIFAQRVAPVQVSYLGYAGTTALNTMDYIIADDTIISKSDELYYTENVIRLPAPLLPRDSFFYPADPPTRLEANLPAQGFVFCAFNNHYKISPSIFDVWMRLLKRVEGSVLWLSAASLIVQKNLFKEAEKRGVEPRRIIFAKRTEKLEDHIARHQLAGLFLDTFPYNAHTTSSDALWAGLPIVTMKGKIFASRIAASLLEALDMEEQITQSLAAYEELSFEIATNAEKLIAIKAKLLNNKTALGTFDVQKYTKNLESALTKIVSN